MNNGGRMMLVAVVITVAVLVSLGVTSVRSSMVEQAEGRQTRRDSGPGPLIGDEDLRLAPSGRGLAPETTSAR